MNYRIKRVEELYGPYSLSDLQRHVEAGQVSLEDLAQSEGMTDWIPVSLVLGTVPIPIAATVGSFNYAEEAPPQLVRLPPNLPWWILLVLSLLTRQLFTWVWALVQANWARKLSRSNTPLVLIAMYPASMISGMAAYALRPGNTSVAAVAGLLVFAGLIFYIVGIFVIKSAMEVYYNSTENIGMQLSPVMTFFFGTVYIQYHVNDLARSRKQAMSMSII